MTGIWLPAMTSFMKNAGFAIYDRNRPAALETYYGIFSLQHRGQESAGITVSDGHTMETFRGMGLVTEVFRKLPEKKVS